MRIQIGGKAKTQRWLGMKGNVETPNWSLNN
jgi:hypothetical protein